MNRQLMSCGSLKQKFDCFRLLDQVELAGMLALTRSLTSIGRVSVGLASGLPHRIFSVIVSLSLLFARLK